MKPLDRDAIWRIFHETVNMKAEELEAWLDTEESRRVGWKTGSGESVGHASGRRIAAILGKPKPEIDEEDYRLMRKASGVIRRHAARRPVNEFTSRWRYALMNWGHDPIK